MEGVAVRQVFVQVLPLSSFNYHSASVSYSPIYHPADDTMGPSEAAVP